MMIKHYRQRIVSVAATLVVALTLSAAAQAKAGLPDFTELAEDNSPAVVNISTKQSSNQDIRKRLPKGLDIPDIPKNSPFHDFFRHFFEDGLGGNLPGMPEREARSLGSGFIISADGYILTNHHVIDGADAIEVRLNDRRSFEAEVIGSDKGSDVALIKIDATDLPVVKIGESKELKVGEWVLAIGSPFGFDHSVTAGIVSAKGRNLPSENYVPFIQTDVAINPGNSGGPLFNLDGEVVGINSQIYSRSGGFMGLSFSIPIELAMNVANQLRDTGTVARGYLGVLIQDIDRDLAESFGLSKPGGALVSRVLPDTPAEAAGLQPGDIILAFNGETIHNSSDLPPLVGASQVDNDAKVEILRAGERMVLPVNIAQLPVDALSSKRAPVDNAPASVKKIGLEIADLDAKARKLNKLKEGGALITKITPGPGQRAGLRVGDVIQMFDGQSVEDADHLIELIDDSNKKSVAVLVLRNGEPMFLALRLG